MHDMQRFIVIFVVAALGVAARLSHPDPFIDSMLAGEHQRSKRAISFQNESIVCFDHEIGCFTWAESNFSGHFPEDPGRAVINTTFQLYNRGPRNDTPTIMFHEDESSYNNVSAFKDTTKKLFVLAHGLGGTARTFWVVDMKNALLKTMDVNVLAVDWRRGSAMPLYNQAVANTMSVGRTTGRMLSEISRIYGYPAENIHYVGFSMGAQVGGFAGRHYYKLTGKKFGRMTILDAAAPGFEKYSVHVNKDDSAFTIAVHTSAGDSIVTGKVGMVTPIGHVDFYPNGGISQPGCRIWEVKCHHERAHHYFLEAVYNSVKPQGCVYVGEHCEEEWKQVVKGKCTTKGYEGEMSLTPKGSGKLYVRTNYTSPFCIPVQKENQVLPTFQWV